MYMAYYLLDMVSYLINSMWRVYWINCWTTETTGHTLAVALGFLALHQDEQKNVYDQILDVVGNDRQPVSSQSPLEYL